MLKCYKNMVIIVDILFKTIKMGGGVCYGRESFYRFA